MQSMLHRAAPATPYFLVFLYFQGKTCIIRETFKKIAGKEKPKQPSLKCTYNPFPRNCCPYLEVSPQPLTHIVPLSDFKNGIMW